MCVPWPSTISERVDTFRNFRHLLRAAAFCPLNPLSRKAAINNRSLSLLRRIGGTVSAILIPRPDVKFHVSVIHVSVTNGLNVLKGWEKMLPFTPISNRRVSSDALINRPVDVGASLCIKRYAMCSVSCSMYSWASPPPWYFQGPCRSFRDKDLTIPHDDRPCHSAGDRICLH